MKDARFVRNRMMLGEEAAGRIEKSSVLLFGLGGVGSYAAEALARAGIGRITIVDSDRVDETNINRQLCALTSTVGEYKTDVVARRILDINPGCSVTKINSFYLPGNSEIDFTVFDYVADAIDTISAKIDIAEKCISAGVPLISCMGTGNKLDPSLLRVGDLSRTETCPVCRVMRTELRKRGINHLTVVWSPEKPRTPFPAEEVPDPRTPASVSFVPGTAGLMMAGKITVDLSKG